MIKIEILTGISLTLFGVFVSRFSDFISKNIPLINVNSFFSSRKSKKTIAIETVSDFYGEQTGEKIVFYVFGIFPIVFGIILIILGAMEINALS